MHYHLYKNPNENKFKVRLRRISVFTITLTTILIEKILEKSKHISLPEISIPKISYSINIKEENGLIEIYFEGNGFLYNMVRIMTGALIDVGHKKISPSDIKVMLENKDRTKSSDTAAAKGLYLYKVSY